MIYDSSIGRVIRDYSQRAVALDAVFSGLTKETCANSCPALPVGCCNTERSVFGLPAALLMLQEHEARLKGWETPETKNPGLCKFHSFSGCYLSTKPQVCLSTLCYRQEENLESVYGDSGKDFVKQVKTVGEHPLLVYSDNFYLFKAMDKAIESGKKLLALKEEKKEVQEVILLKPAIQKRKSLLDIIAETLF